MSELKFERLTNEVVLIDGKHYRMMSDEETAEFIWSPESGLTQRVADSLKGNHMQISYEPYELIDSGGVICPRCNERCKLLCPRSPNQHYGLPAFYICGNGHIGQVGVGQITPPNTASTPTNGGLIQAESSSTPAAIRG
jgi:hypothetical protein